MSTASQENKTSAAGWGWPVWIGLLTLAVFGIRSLAHSDFWIHLASGRAIAGQGILRSDIFTFTALGQPWVNGSWLYDRLLFVLWNIGGAPLIIIVHMALVVAAFALVVPVTRRLAGPLATGCAVLLAAWLVHGRLTVSPIAPSLLMVALFIRILSGEARPRALIVLVLLQVLWANLHSTFIFGPFLCALFAFDRWRRNREAGETHSMVRHGGLVVACLAAAVLNPYGPAVYEVPFQGWDQASRLVVQEWISPFSVYFSHAFFTKHVVTLALLIGALGLLAEKRKLPIAITILAVCGAFLAVRSLWHAEFFALMALPFLALSLSASAAFVQDKLQPVLGSAGAWRRHVAVALVVLLAVFSIGAAVSNASYVMMGNPAAFGLGVAEEAYPSEALALLGRPDFPERVVNMPHDGGYLAWRLPNKKWFVDTRVGLFDRALLTALAQSLMGNSAAWEELDAQWKPGAVLLNGGVVGSGALLRTLLSDAKWKLVYFDGTSAVLLRGESMPVSLADNAALQLHGLQVLEEARQAYQEQLQACGRPVLPSRLAAAGNLFMALSRYPEARAIYRLLVRGAPAMTQAWFNLGIACLSLGQAQEAIPAFEEAGRRMPANPAIWTYLARAYEAAGMPGEAETARLKAGRLQPGNAGSPASSAAP